MLARTTGAVLTLLFTVYLAQILGPTDYGVFTLSLTIVTIVTVLSRFGLDNVVMKNVAINFEFNPKLASGYIIGSLRFVAIWGSVLTLILLIVAMNIGEDIFGHVGLIRVLSRMSFIVVPVSLSFIIAEALKSLNRPVLSAVLQTLMIPIIAIAGLLWLQLHDLVSIENAVMVYSIACVVTLSFLLIVLITGDFRLSNYSKISSSKLVKQGWHLLLISSSALIMSWTDVIILGVMSDAESVGIYSISSRLVLASTLFLMAANSIVGPQYAILFEKKNFNKMQDISSNVSLILMVLSLISTVVLVFFSRYFLSFMGEGYEVGYQVIVILSIGQLVNVSCGSVSVILIVSGLEKTLRNIFYISALFNIIASLVCVKYLGMFGVAYATSASMVLWNVWSIIEIKKKLGFWAFANIKL